MATQPSEMNIYIRSYGAPIVYDLRFSSDWLSYVVLPPPRWLG